jgi:hypothetical protein
MRSTDMVQEIALCAMQYRNNLCATNPIPAMAQQCGIWETCMQRDPTVIGRAKVGAELIAEVVNGFVEPISWKTLVSYSTIVVRFVPMLTKFRSPSSYPIITRLYLRRSRSLRLHS